MTLQHIEFADCHLAEPEIVLPYNLNEMSHPDNTLPQKIHEGFQLIQTFCEQEGLGPYLLKDGKASKLRYS